MTYNCAECGSNELSIYEKETNADMCDPCWDSWFYTFFWTIEAFRDLCNKT